MNISQSLGNFDKTMSTAFNQNLINYPSWCNRDNIKIGSSASNHSLEPFDKNSSKANKAILRNSSNSKTNSLSHCNSNSNTASNQSYKSIASNDNQNVNSEGNDDTWLENIKIKEIVDEDINCEMSSKNQKKPGVTRKDPLNNNKNKILINIATIYNKGNINYHNLSKQGMNHRVVKTETLDKCNNYFKSSSGKGTVPCLGVNCETGGECTRKGDIMKYKKKISELLEANTRIAEDMARTKQENSELKKEMKILKTYIIKNNISDINHLNDENDKYKNAILEKDQIINRLKLEISNRIVKENGLRVSEEKHENGKSGHKERRVKEHKGEKKR